MIFRRSMLPCLLLAAATARAASPTVTPQNTVITSSTYEGVSTDTETTSDFSENVVVTGTNLRMTCDRLIVVTTRVTDKTATIGKQTGFKSLLAIGHVHMTQNDGLREATCGQAQVFPTEDKIVLTQDPVVIDRANGSRATGDVIELYRGDRRVHGQHVQITLPPVKDLGFDKNQKPNAPAPLPAAPSIGIPPSGAESGPSSAGTSRSTSGTSPSSSAPNAPSAAPQPE
jgi:lipopolysaccharide export system protein LptA